jgi:hypothetical protein
MQIALCLLPTSGLAQTAESYYEAGERALKDAIWVDAGRAFEQAAKIAPKIKRYQDRFAEVPMEASRRAVSAARLRLSLGLNTEAQSFIEDDLRFDPNNADAAELSEHVNALNERLSKLYAVQTVFVDKIEGDQGKMAREQLKAALANAGRFRVLIHEDKDDPADATISGRAELKEVGGQKTTSAQAEGTARGAGMSGRSTESQMTLTSASVVLSLTLKSGEIVWGWDDTKTCKETAKPKCAIDGLVSTARRW